MSTVKNKLIFFEGSPGSGKSQSSTTLSNKIQSFLVSEVDEDNPFKELTVPKTTTELFNRIQSKWVAYRKEQLDNTSSKTWLFDGGLLQHVINPAACLRASAECIEPHLNKVLNLIHPHEVKIVYFNWRIAKNASYVLNQRGDDFVSKVVNDLRPTPYGENFKSLSDFEFVAQYYEEIYHYYDYLLAKLDLPILKIDRHIKQDWPSTISEIQNFI